MTRSILILTVSVALACLAGCTQETKERHYREDTIRRESPTMDENRAPREGDRRPGNATEERRSEQKIVVE